MEGSASYGRVTHHPQNGKIFLPINIDGIETVDHFMTIPKLIALGGISAMLLLIIMNSVSGGINMFIGIVLWLIASSYVVRYVVFEEKRYYTAYLQTKKVEVCTPAEFYKITSVKETPAGSVIMFNNGLVGLLVKLERGTVVGRPSDFMGEHYDAMSEMFRQLLKAGLRYVILDVCESTGNESTVDVLGRLTVNSSNKGINKLMELQVGFIKTLVNDTIYTKDYLLIYTEASRVGTLIAESEEALRMALEGAIDGYDILDHNGISLFVSEYFGVGFFSGEDVLRAGVVKKAFKVVGVEYEDGVVLTIGDEERAKLEKQVKGVEQGKFTARQVSLRKAMAAGGNDDTQGFLTDIPVAGTGVLFEAPLNAPETHLEDLLGQRVQMSGDVIKTQSESNQSGFNGFPQDNQSGFMSQGFSSQNKNGG